MSIANQFKRTKALNKSTVRKDKLVAISVSVAEKLESEDSASDVKQPVDSTIPKQKRGRPPTGFDPKTYHREYQRDKRSADKLGISVKEFRAQKQGQDK